MESRQSQSKSRFNRSGWGPKSWAGNVKQGSSGYRGSNSGGGKPVNHMNNLKPRMNTTRLGMKIFCALTALGLEVLPASAQDPCVRYPQGSIVAEPENLYSTNGVLQVDFTYQTSENAYGQTTHRFVNSDGAQSPTLHLNPGDTLMLTLTNLVPEQPGKHGHMADMPDMEVSTAGAGGSGAMNMTASSVNVHYHGDQHATDLPRG